MLQTCECVLAYINECEGLHVYIAKIDIIYLLISSLTLPSEIIFTKQFLILCAISHPISNPVLWFQEMSTGGVYVKNMTYLCEY